MTPLHQANQVAHLEQRISEAQAQRAPHSRIRELCNQLDELRRAEADEIQTAGPREIESVCKCLRCDPGALLAAARAEVDMQPKGAERNASSMVPTPDKGWVRMRVGSHFSQWCKGAVCVKLRTSKQSNKVTHYADVICPYAMTPRRQASVLRAFGLTGAVKVNEEVGSARFALEVTT